MHVVSVSSLKGGVGKTSVVLGLASAAMARGVPTLVVDLDPQGDATAGLDAEARRGVDLAAVLDNPRRKVVEASLAPSGWVPSTTGVLDVVTGSARSARHDEAKPSTKELGRLAEALGKLDDAYHLVLIDCPPSPNGLTRTGLVASRRAVVVTEPGLFAVAAADRGLRLVDDLRRGPAPDLQPLGVVVNRVRARSLEHGYRLAEMQQLFGPLVLSPVLPERSALQQAQGAAKPVHQWRTAGGRELAASFDALLDRTLRSAGHRRRR